MSQSALETHGATSDALLDAFWTKVPNTAAPRRRGCPRVHANVPVRVSGSDCKPLKTRTNDLSLGGLQIRCDRASMASLHADPAALLRGDSSAPPKELTLLLTIDGQTLRVNARGELAHLSLLQNSSKTKEVAVGLKFVDFEEGGRESLLRFIEYHMRPAGV